MNIFVSKNLENIKSRISASALHKHPILDLGFRPFFMGAAIFSVISIVIWMGIYLYGLPLQPNYFAPTSWHAHEMIFGYGMAVIAGFLLTAVQNWTDVRTLHGYPLLGLFMLWAAARILPFFDTVVSLGFIAIMDNLFIVCLIFALMIPIFKAKEWKRLAIMIKLLTLLACNIVFYLGVMGIIENGVRWGLYAGLYLIIALILTLIRKLIPLFVERGTGCSVETKYPAWVDVLSIAIFLIFMLSDIMAPASYTVAISAALLFCIHSVRIVAWYTDEIWGNSLLWVLFVAYSLIIMGFALKLMSFLLGISPYLAIHSFSFGGIGMISIGMMSRVSLGHTGGDVLNPPATVKWIFITLLSGAVIRVFFPLVAPSLYISWVAISQLLWAAAFTLFLFLYGPILLRPENNKCC